MSGHTDSEVESLAARIDGAQSHIAAVLRELVADRIAMRDALCDPVFLNHDRGCINRTRDGECDCGVHALNARRPSLIQRGLKLP